MRYIKRLFLASFGEDETKLAPCNLIEMQEIGLIWRLYI